MNASPQGSSARERYGLVVETIERPRLRVAREASAVERAVRLSLALRLGYLCAGTLLIGYAGGLAFLLVSCLKWIIRSIGS